MADWTDQEVVRHCRECKNKQEALNFFLTHFNKRFNKTIFKTLLRALKNNQTLILKDSDFEDAVGCIGEGIVERLTLTDLFQKILDAEKPLAYFARIIRNATIDWIRQQHTNKNVPKINALQKTVSLSDHAFRGSDTPVEDFVSDPSEMFSLENDNEISAAVKKIWKEIENHRDNHRLVLRVALMECQPLSSEIIEEISHLRMLR